MPRAKITQTDIGSGIPLVPLTTAQAKALPNNTMFLDKSFQLSYKTNQGRTAPILNPTGGAIVPIGVTLLNSNGNAVNPSPWPTIKFAGSAVSVTDVPEFGYSTVTIEQPVGVEYTANKNQPSGYAGLNSSGKIESAQLPSYVDDIEEYANLAALPGTGETGKIYVTLDNNKQFRWSGSVYVDINTAKQDTSEKNQPLGYAGLDAGGLIDFNQLPDLNLGTAANLDVAVSGDAGAGEVVKGDDSRLSDARPTAPHTVASHSDYPLNGYVTYDDFGFIALPADVTAQANSVNFIRGDSSNNTSLGKASWNTISIGSSNTSFGSAAGGNITSGSQNTTLGSQSGSGITTGSRNVTLGYIAGKGILSGVDNIAIGYQSLYGVGSSILTTNGQIGIGYQTLYAANASSSSNIAIGYQSFFQLNTGTYNTAIGTSSGGSLTSGASNVMVGGVAGYGITTGSRNVSLGHNAGKGISTGSDNVAIGSQSMYASGGVAVLTTVGQVAIGSESLYSANASSAFNTAIGYQSLKAVTSGASNTALGYQAGTYLTTGNDNTAIGYQAGLGIINTGRNVAIGYRSLYGNGSGLVTTNDNTAIGYTALFKANSSSAHNTAVGSQSSYNLTAGAENVTVGYFAGYGITTSTQNVAIGVRALSGNGNTLPAGSDGQVAVGTDALMWAATNSYGNTAIGYQSLKALTSGSSNTAIGYNAGLSSTGLSNTFMGYQAGLSNVGHGNTFIGYCSGPSSLTGSNNIFIGYSSGTSSASGNDNIFIGDNAGESMTLQDGETTGAVTNAIAIGTDTLVDKSNKVQLGNSAVDEMDFSDKLRFTTTAIIPLQTSETVDIGTDDGMTPHRFNQINLNSVNLVDRVTDAPTPAAGITLYMMGGALKFIDSSGTIKTVTAV